MLGDTVSLAKNLWIVLGDMPADVPNVLYRKDDRLYLLDSGAGPTTRASILQMLNDLAPAQSFTLLNSHAHADHVGNNDVIRLAQAKETHHYIAEAGLALLDGPSYSIPPIPPRGKGPSGPRRPGLWSTRWRLPPSARGIREWQWLSSA
jgi:glyoxylase-like metal-dependent hydrolase (beta-lactamase superfamily II)